MKFDIFFGLILAHASLSLGEIFFDLKSVGTLKKPDSFDTGCIFTGTEVIYQCINTVNTESGGDDHSDFVLPEALNLRIDCRGARGNFRNLSLFDSKRSCGRLSYRKYGNSSDVSEIKPLIIGELPLVSHHVVTIEKEDILDIQCVPFDLEFHNGLYHQGMTYDDWVIPFNLIKDGHDGRRLILAFDFAMLVVSKGSKSVSSVEFSRCTEALTEAFRWKMTLSKSMGFSHWIRYSSPAPAVPAVPSSKKPIFPEMDEMGGCNISGEIFQVDKDILQLTVLEARGYSIFGPEEFKKTSKPNEWYVRLDPDFYNATFDQNYFGMDFKLEVNPEILLPYITDVKVKLQLFRINLGLSSADPYRSFELTLPVNSTGLQDSKSESRVVWMIAFFFFICLLCGFCYVYREDFQMSTEPKLRDRNLLAEANSVSIELQGS